MNPTIDPEKDYYTILEVAQGASQEEIKRAYRGLARRYHPDSHAGDVQRFRLVQEAYEVLQDPVVRKAYDRQRASRGLTPDAPVVIETTLSQSCLPALNSPQMIYLLMDVQPAKHLPRVRQSLNLALVIDRSTSMRGRRIENVKMAARDLVDSLQPNDRLTIVSFSDRAEVLAPSTLARDKSALQSAISQMMPGGGTEIYQGVLAGLQEVRRFAGKGTIDHVILLTDGRTYGDEDLALAEARRAGEEGIGISAMGIGEDWNDLFLDALARYGGGVSQYIRSPSQLQALLSNQIRDLGTIVARQAQLHLLPAPKVEIQSAYRVAPYIETLHMRSDHTAALGNLGEDPLVILMDMTVQREHGGASRLLRMELEAETHDGQQVSVRQDVSVDFVSGRPESEEVPSRMISFLSRLSIYRLQERAWQALESGQTQEATALLESAATRLFDLGYQDLARAALVEANRVTREGGASMQGRKTVRYGTRSLMMSSPRFGGTKEVGNHGKSQ